VQATLREGLAAKKIIEVLIQDREKKGLVAFKRKGIMYKLENRVEIEIRT
jgi:hypothetical protein